MSLKCWLGFHTWNGCTCTTCGKVRNEQHHLDGCTCTTCGKACEEKHNWEGCTCTLCGIARNKQHTWNGCTCLNCGTMRDEQHSWLKDCEECSTCGKQRADRHNWDGCTCTLCGKVRDKLHDWSRDCQQCARCGKTRNTQQHSWNGCTCTACDQTRTGYHDTGKSVEQQSIECLTPHGFQDQANAVCETVTDADGNVYHTVKIGAQTWTIENLKTTKYNDGTVIPLITGITAWENLTTEAYSWYNNDPATYKKTYGALYNWNAVNTGKLAPVGWHVPTDAEWGVLESYLIANGYNYDGTTTGNKISKALALKTGWETYSEAYSATGTIIGNHLSANNRSGFSAIPSGYRNNGGVFDGMGVGGYWWSATGVSYAYFRSLICNNGGLYRNGANMSYGFSVRLLRNK